MQRGGSVYVMTNKNNTTLYIGVSSDLQSRVYEHKNKVYINSFTARYNLNKLVFYENFATIEEAIEREKQLKGWLRKKKLNLINNFNSDWIDLYPEIENW